MLTLILGTLIIAMTYGAFWHNQPARLLNDRKGDPGFRGRLVNRALEWLVLMPRVSNPAEKNKPGVLIRRVVLHDTQTGFFLRAVHCLLAWNHWRRILLDRAATQSSVPTHLFKPQEITNALAAEKTA